MRKTSGKEVAKRWSDGGVSRYLFPGVVFLISGLRKNTSVILRFSSYLSQSIAQGFGGFNRLIISFYTFSIGIINTSNKFKLNYCKDLL